MAATSVLRTRKRPRATAVGSLAGFEGRRLTLTTELSDHAGIDYARVRESALVSNTAEAEALGRSAAAALLASNS